MLSIALAALAAQAVPAPVSRALGTCDRPRPTVSDLRPSTIAAVHLVQSWLAVMKRSDDVTFIRFVQDHGPILDDGPDQWLAVRNLLRGLQFCGIKSADARSMELWMLDPNNNPDSFAIARFKLVADEPSKIVFIGIGNSNGVPPGFVRPARLSTSKLSKAVRARVSRDVENDRFSGAVLIARQGSVIFQHAYGFANRETHMPNDLNTQFRFGSMGKMFTIVAIMQLVQDGKVDLSAPIGRYLKDYPNQDVATKVTVANLLTHTGGTGDIFGADFDARKSTLRDLKDYVDLFGKRSLKFPPGSQVEYSNYGFILLGRIVEEVAHLSYGDYVQRNIFNAARMTSTGNLPESIILPHRAVAYTGFGNNLTRADGSLPLSGSSAGGGYSTVGDLNKFVNALTSYRLLRATTLRQLIDGGIKTDDMKFIHYDFGGMMEGIGPFIGHNGEAPGMSGALYHFLDSSYTVIVLANRDAGPAENIALFAAHELPAN